MSSPVEALPGIRKKGAEVGEKTILLDMDGVCADFVSSACLLFGRDPIAEHAKICGWDFFVHWGLTASDFWQRIDMVGEPFWTAIKPEPWGMLFYDSLRAMAPVYFCSSAALSPSAWSGKIKWLREFVGIGHFNNVVLTPHKHLLARPTNCLIDDSEENVEAFKRLGGKAILFPRLWNKGHLGEHREQTIVEEVQEWLI